MTDPALTDLKVGPPARAPTTDQNFLILCSFLVNLAKSYMSYFAYACKTEGKNGISRLISGLCVNCLNSILEYSRLNHLDVYLV